MSERGKADGSGGPGFYQSKLKTLREEVHRLKSQVKVPKGLHTPLGSESTIAHLQQQNDSYQLRIQREKNDIQSLEGQVAALNQRITQQRQVLKANAEEHKSQAENAQKQIKGLENRIEKELQLYNQVVAHNKKLIAKVNELRRERIHYSQMLKQLDEELRTKQRQKQQIEEANEVAAKERETTAKQIAAVTKEVEQRKAEFELNREAIAEVLAQESRQPAFEPVAEVESEASESLVLPDEDPADQRVIQQCEASLAHHEQALARLAEVAGNADLEQVVELYLNEEMQNFSIFTHVSHLTNEVDRLVVQNAETKEKINQVKAKDLDKDRQAKIGQLQQELERLKLREEGLLKKREKSRKTVDALKQGIADIFQVLKIDPAQVEGLKDFADRKSVV